MAGKILVVEDDQPIRELMDLLIRKTGHYPELVPNGIDAMEAVRKSPPDLILLDIMMPRFSGWEFLEKLRADPATVDLPVLLFSASPLVEEKMAGMNDPKLGMLPKPVSFTEMKREIGKYLADDPPAGPE